MTVFGFLPSPEQSVWYLGPVPVRAYALAIMAGIVVAIWLGERRWKARGGQPGAIMDVAVWAVPFGIVGARIYHVITSPDRYFGPDGNPWLALRIWEGGLGIWGAVALGAVGAVIACRRLGIRIPVLADAVAPGILLAQGIGRLGNWFNSELFGQPTTVPWALEIAPVHRPEGYVQFATFHPTFLYELLWCVAGTAVLLWADRRFRLGHGQVFWLYVAYYTLGRFWIEALRIDEAQQIAGMRLNNWVSVAVFALAVVLLLRSRRAHPKRETTAYVAGREPAPEREPEPENDPRN